MADGTTYTLDAAGAATQQITGVSSEAANNQLAEFWPQTNNEIREMTTNDFKTQELPLARIKKIMKLDDDVKMISQEAPVVFARATEMFISELTLRSWIHTEENKRRTLQRNDIAMAISKYDQFDFLIDIVPRDELKPAKRPEDTSQRTAMMPDQVQYYFQLAQQHQQALNQQNNTTTPNTGSQPVQLQVVAPQQAQQQVMQLQMGGTTLTQGASGDGSAPQIIQVQGGAPVVQQTQQQPAQVIHQIVTPSGEVQNVPIQLTQAQLQSLQLQVQGQRAGQPIVLQGGAAGALQLQATQDQQQQQQQPMFQIQQMPGFTAGGNQQQLLVQLHQGATDDQGQEDTS